MKILFLARYFYPHIGGVEKHSLRIGEELVKQGCQVTVLTLQHDKKLLNYQTYHGIKIIRIPYSGSKWGIWQNLWPKRQLFQQADVIHCHDIFFWYLPFRFLYPFKPVFTTFHGWEGQFPIPKKNIWLRKIWEKLSWGNICVGDYVIKHYGIKSDKIMYGAADLPKKTNFKKDYRRLVYVGRLDQDTGLNKILAALSYLKNYKIEFCGDGPLASECKKYGPVHGFDDPGPLLAKSFICLSPGYISILEAFANKCLVVTTYNNPVKKDYLLMTPFAQSIIVKASPLAMAQAIKHYSKHPSAAQAKIKWAYGWVKTQNWQAAVKLYQQLWQQ